MNIDFQILIVAIDLSEFSETVVAQARKMAEVFHKPISFIYVESQKEKDLGSLRSLILAKYKIMNPEDLFIRFGDPAQAILEFSEGFSSPLLVAGYRGGHIMAELFLGSVVKNLALLTKCPLWIHRSQKVSIPKKIMLPLALDRNSGPLLRVSQCISQIFDAELEVFHSMKLPRASVDSNSYGVVYEAFEEADQKAVQQFKKDFPQVRLVASEGEPGFEIREHTRYFDLLILAPTYRGEKIPFFGTTTTHLMNSGDESILIIPGMNHP